MSALQIAMAAGETSGDLLAGAVIRQLSMRLPPDSRYFGIGGAQMRAAGFQARFPSEKLAVRGYVEAARHLPEILWLRRAFKRTLRAAPPSVFVGVDAPDFNLGLECALRRAGIPTVHFISPSIWAWRGARIHKIKRATDLMLCVFPFETEIYARAGIVHRYVGHPLADLIPFKPDPMAARRTLGLPESRPAIVAVLPGSRNSEIARIAPVFFAAMARMHERGRRLRFVMPAASPAIRGALQRLAGRYPQLPLSLIDGHSHRALEACDAALVASGTATLEAALYKKPMVISYQVPWLTAQIMKRQGYLPYIGLPNILAGRFIVPELLQRSATPNALADALFDQLDNDANRRALNEIFTQLHHTLKRGAAARAADAIAEVIHAARHRR
ncbi:Lipid-A-disaccharide synthase [Candidatus Glomeribacter gigasporarum BEG34]|uniref:Lipid-A-disaccharide synthase n=1 Tax=Candidatus Glomeribacter gigasporarum BEG34 TaxID=1070319 RepID=G2J9U4_9BURK|nr:lipid-A-disaccharide synthase [Candidatus Glomeribacter gigasporarum]CCD29541.1 Lipid-A-disaccharide synthase [Candidatus Glomeribacter gigasporarum BEG34]